MLGNREFYIKLLEIMIPLKPAHQSKDKKAWSENTNVSIGKWRTKLKEKWKRLERGCRRGQDSQRRGSDTKIRYPALSTTVLSPLIAQLVFAVTQENRSGSTHTILRMTKLSLN